jgi:hypothetical protein
MSTVKVNSSKNSSLAHLMRLFEKQTDMTYCETEQAHHQNLDNLVDSYTDELAIKFQRMMVNKRALVESEDEIALVDDGQTKKAFFVLDMIHLDTHIECARLNKYSSHTAYHEVLNHTTQYGMCSGSTFQAILTKKLRKKLNHISKFIQNKTKVDGKLVLGTQLFDVYAELILDFDEDMRLGMIQAVLVPKEL